jgi:hypothetical protein
LARHCKILRKGEGLARSLKEKDCGKKENIARSVKRRKQKKTYEEGVVVTAG